MRLYLCQDGSYAGTQADAKLRGKNFEQIEVPTDKDGLLSYLNQMVNAVEDLRPATDPWAGHETDPMYPLPVAQSAPLPPSPSHSAQLVAFEDQWAEFPLARKLHFAALACEDAREAIR